MSTVLHPVGPNPPRVYWVRRAVVLVAIALVVALAALAVWAFALRDDGAVDAAGTEGAAGSNASVDGEQPADDAAEEGDQADDATPGDCTAADLELSVTPDAALYPADVAPVLQVAVANVGSAPCTVDAGDASRQVVISSGTDRIWASQDCATSETASRQLLLDVGARDSVDITWARVRSAQECAPELPATRAGTYQVVATLLGASSAPAVFGLE